MMITKMMNTTMLMTIMNGLMMMLMAILTEGVFLGDPKLVGERENDGNVTIKDPAEWYLC